MKLHLVAAAALALCGAQLAQAAPVTKAQAAAAAAAGRKIMISGASALQASVKNAFAQAACANSADVTQFNGTASNIFAYACTIKAGGYAGLPANQVAVIFHTVVDGSLKSIEGLSTDAAKQVNFITDAVSCTGADGGTTVTGCTVAKARSQGGFSDVELALFKDYLGSNPVPGVNLAQINATPVFAGQSFGVAVSLPLYRALQAAQNLPAGCQDDAVALPGGAVTVNGDDDFAAACQPSITRQQYASTVAIDSKSGITSLFAPYHWTHLGLTADNEAAGVSNAQKVHIVRRPATSGTQAASNAFFLGRNCVADATSPLADADDTAGITVEEQSSTGTALTNIGAGTTASAPNQFRIGVASAENAPGSGLWRFVKLDGVAVNEDAGHRKATVEQRYDFAGEFSLHRSTVASITPALAGNVMAQLANDMANPETTNLRGIFIRPETFFYDATDATLSRVHQATRGGNWCQPFKYQF